MVRTARRKAVRPGMVWLALGVGMSLCAWWLFSHKAAPQAPATFARENTAAVSARAAAAQTPGLAEASFEDQKTGFLARIGALREKIAALPKPSNTYTSQVRQLLAAWAQTDPEAALSYALSSEPEDPVGKIFFESADAALTVWASRDLGAARAYVEQQSGSTRLAAELGPSLMRAYFTMDPQQAQEWVRSGFKSDSTELRPVVARELVALLHEQGRTPEIETWLADPQVAETAYAGPAVRYYAGLLARTDPTAALAFSKTLPRGSTTRNLALEETVHAWATADLTRARDWIIAQKTPIDVARPDLFRDVENPVPLPPECYTSGELDYAIAGYVLAVAQTSSPKVAMNDLTSIWNPSLRKRLTEKIAAMEPSVSRDFPVTAAP